MKTDDIKYLDGKFTVQEQVPTTYVEIQAILGTEENVVEEAADNVRYRNKYPRVYSAVSEELAKSHGFPKAVVRTKLLADKKTVRNVHESDNDHIRAFLNGRKAVAEVLDADGTTVKTPAVAEVVPAPDAETTLTALFQKHATAEPLFTESERAGGTGKIGKEAMDSANAFFAAGDATVAKVVAKIEAVVSGYKVDTDADSQPTPEGLARGIMRLNKQLLDEQKKASAKLLADAVAE